jgi:FtsP/CotA-like multicopper oxidase with cupredoxin domain
MGPKPVILIRRRSIARGFNAGLIGTLALAITGLGVLGGVQPTLAGSPEPCPLPAAASVVADPPEIRSVGGQLQADLSIYGYRAADGRAHYCYRSADGRVAPTLRVHPGDRVRLRLTNRLTQVDADAAMSAAHEHHAAEGVQRDPCSRGAMTPLATNLHFHGMTLPPVCHQDEVLRTSVLPEDPPFEYRFTVPPDEPPGIYWYHPHIHGYTNRQVTGGASGALIVEGIERAIPEVAGLAERVFVLRDPTLSNPDAPPSSAEPVVPAPVLDPDGEIANNNTGFGKPARDLSINFVPVPYPDYPPARIRMHPGERQLWRVVNAASITYVHLALLYDHLPQNLGVVAIDGVPVDIGSADAPHVKVVDHLAIPPGSRAEFIVQGPRTGQTALLITRMIDTGQDGENDPNRPIAAIEASADAPEPPHLPPRGRPLAREAHSWVGDVQPVRIRRLYFSERRSDPADPRSPTLFFLTEEGHEPKVFDPTAGPDIVVRQGTVEDWIIENRSLELHDFHIHQLHFQLRQWYGIEVDESFLRDTVSVPFFDNHMTAYPSVRIRLDFRDSNTVGTFAYHCHLLEHEDGGMMGEIRVEPAP